MKPDTPYPSPCDTCPRYRRHCDQGRWRKCPVYREWLRRVWAIVTGKGEDINGLQT